MKKELQHYQILAGLFEHPSFDYITQVQEIEKYFLEKNKEVAKEIHSFYELIKNEETKNIQDLYTRSFDLQAITTLDIGYVVFGDDYKRGKLLSNLNREHMHVDNDCRGELADHLPNILRLIPFLKDKEVLEDLVSEILFPALNIMLYEFDPSRLEKKDKFYQKHYKTVIEYQEHLSTAYVHCLRALKKAMEHDFPQKEKEKESLATMDFLKSLRKEAEIEEKYESK